MKLSLFGAAPDTGNLGVSALCYASLYSVVQELPDAQVTVFDHGRGREARNIDLGGGRRISFFRQGAVNSRRFYRPENLKLMKIAALFGGLGNGGLKTISRSDAVLDISGGDSFTDLYGSRCFETIILPKQLSLQQKRPLILLPQTYGPFTDSACEKKASEIVKRARSAWARDARSFEILKDLLGSSFDPAIHRCGVDVAFGLPAKEPDQLPQDLEEFFAADTAKVGINVSGLIYNNFLHAREQFGFKADYKRAVADLVNRFLTETECHIALVPHVVTPKGHHESDVDACRDLVAQFSDPEMKKRLTVVPAYANPCEVKWVISRFDWFCGTRMHATIAALSSAVPVSAISYSPKTLGVFETCGQGEHVADPQLLDERDVVDLLWSSWKSRHRAESKYDTFLPSIKLLLKKQAETYLNV